MAKTKACLKCKAIFEEGACPICGETETTDTVKGKVYIFNPEKSEIANNIDIKKSGVYAIKTR